jgi:hypothetical protein
MRRFIPAAIVFTIISFSFVLTSNQGSGPLAATSQITRVTDGAEAHINTNGSNLRINGVVLVAQADGSAVLTGSIVNRAEDPDQFLGAAINGTQGNFSGAKLLTTHNPIHLFGEYENAKIVFDGLNAVPGKFVNVTFGFAEAGIASLNVMVVEKSGVYENISSGSELTKTN